MFFQVTESIPVKTDLRVVYRQNGFDRFYYEIFVNEVSQVMSIRDFETEEDARNHAASFVSKLGWGIVNQRKKICR